MTARLRVLRGITSREWPTFFAVVFYCSNPFPLSYQSTALASLLVPLSVWKVRGGVRCNQIRRQQKRWASSTIFPIEVRSTESRPSHELLEFNRGTTYNSRTDMHYKYVTG
jgi:hypothetical protein